MNTVDAVSVTVYFFAFVGFFSSVFFVWFMCRMRKFEKMKEVKILRNTEEMFKDLHLLSKMDDGTVLSYDCEERIGQMKTMIFRINREHQNESWLLLELIDVKLLLQLAWDMKIDFPSAKYRERYQSMAGYLDVAVLKVAGIKKRRVGK